MEKYKEKILELKDGKCWIWPESDYGRAEIWFKNDTYFLFIIPTFGGNPYYDSHYNKNNIDKLIDVVNSWS